MKNTVGAVAYDDHWFLVVAPDIYVAEDVEISGHRQVLLHRSDQRELVSAAGHDDDVVPGRGIRSQDGLGGPV
ncbi:MAG: hypothetical protein GY856_27235 [bacterium]|nr:hypothetical protein [bacterium]